MEAGKWPTLIVYPRSDRLMRKSSLVSERPTSLGRDIMWHVI